jgi:hypothetical protein
MATARKKSSSRSKSSSSSGSGNARSTSAKKNASKSSSAKKSASKSSRSHRSSSSSKKSSGRKYGPKAQKSVEREMHEFKRGKLKSGKSGKKVTNPKQAIAIGLSEARRSGAKVPKKKAA